jgi:hypothetical protein
MAEKSTTVVYVSVATGTFPSAAILCTTKFLFALQHTCSKHTETKQQGNISPFSPDTDDGFPFTRTL